ncbi:MAG TPA: tRNA (N(6)-L-threonylcarbamoyladenosine(37)-C(2))-methylthiotransferase MtaB, partial [Gammaproteobacteria bacterium]|nr:tRNA (N(6)-L-threonylcarbamoyladenosine(37)-C(2))-methylthiotransferase MtaB [Gammaproteobacteria bacterium]
MSAAPHQANPSGLAAITTLGCKINSFESAAMAQDLERDQWSLVDPTEFADVYVINSCTVTAEADRQTRQAVRRALRQNP